MPTTKVDLEACPVCDLPVAMSILTDQGSMLTTSNLTQYRTCLQPTLATVDGAEKAAVYLVYHEGDPEATAPPDPSVLDDDHRAVYQGILAANGSIKRGYLAGKVASAGIEPEELPPLLDELVAGGYIEELDDAVYAVAE